MSILGTTKVRGLFGNPVGHSISPQIQNALSKEINENAVYVPFHVEGSLKDAVAGAYAMGIDGLNVTIPFKQEIMNYVEVDDEAKKIGAVNTLLRTKYGYKGFNTDVIGLEETFNKRGVTLQGKTVLILGAGGAAYAAGIMAAKNGAAKIIIANRSLKNADILAQQINCYYNVVVEVTSLDGISGKLDSGIAALIQTTSVGMAETKNQNPLGTADKAADVLKNVGMAVDIIYNPDKTRLLLEAERMGIPAVNGLDMLLYQAMASFEIWMGEALDREIKVRVYNEITASQQNV